MTNRAKFKTALAALNLVVAWAAMAYLPKDNTSFSYRSEVERALKQFFLSFDWSMIFMIVGMSVLVTVALWLILSSYGKLPSGDAPQSPDDNDA